MTSSSQIRRWIILLAALFGSCVACLWSWFHLNALAKQADDAKTNLEQTQAIAAEVLRLRNLTAIEGLISPKDYQPGQLVANARQQAGIPNDRLNVSVRPGRTLKDANLQERYVEMPVLGEVKIENLIRFLAAIDETPVFHQVKAIALTPSAANKTPGRESATWDVRVELAFFAKVADE